MKSSAVPGIVIPRLEDSTADTLAVQLSYRNSTDFSQIVVELLWLHCVDRSAALQA
jgi:hypothetical protein